MESESFHGACAHGKSQTLPGNPNSSGENEPALDASFLTCPDFMLREENPQCVEKCAEEFSTTRWVRSRSGTENSPQVTLSDERNSNKICRMEPSCDHGTWQWVCNHKQRS